MVVVTITVGNINIRVETLDTPTAAAIVAACPIRSRANTWGEEVYFSTPVRVSRETNARAIVEAGELAPVARHGLAILAPQRVELLHGVVLLLLRIRPEGSIQSRPALVEP